MQFVNPALIGLAALRLRPNVAFMIDKTTPGRPVGPLVQNWQVPSVPSGETLQGRYACLEPLSADAHAALLYRQYAGEDTVWDYLPYGPFSSASQYHRWVRDNAGQADPFFYAVRNLEADQWEGVASFLRTQPAAGSIEVGHINLSPALQRTRAATEAMFLMMKWAFEAGYRRYEWKCDALNMPSRRAAQRLGFSYEGVFRQATVVKGRNRDTAWFAAIDSEWPALKEAYEAWLRPENFDEQGKQRENLGDMTRLVRVASDPAL
ncbi:Protein N-acetyltransferase, RimJ/RimL family [Sulfitobacter brevis]|uniref:Protein N-acetyltransferase, RimJ/RimL family n=2 Tax=Sulfitobacter brevis TaxID=74348 RepID=A0A1I1TUK4_9RHOB|nr:Protein N-acetyltransferase, RimJ/RimL family [Sulfitobacter brevis]